MIFQFVVFYITAQRIYLLLYLPTGVRTFVGAVELGKDVSYTYQSYQQKKKSSVN